MYGRDMERLVRSMKNEGTEVEYIRHYLMETFQCDNRQVDSIFERCGIADAGLGPMPAKPDPKPGGH